MIPILASDPCSPFPDPETALDEPPGLLAAGGDLDPVRLVNAYCHGIFPWYSEGQPILWWSPVPRCVIYPARVHLARRLRRQYNQGHFRLTADQAFEQVITACATVHSRSDGTWITPAMQAAYVRLHQQGIAHSVEVWVDKQLVGGIYGVALGAVFFGESMFSRCANASKIALLGLCRQLQRWQYALLDCQISNPHLQSMGSIEIPRDVFQRHLLDVTAPDHWGGDFHCESRW